MKKITSNMRGYAMKKYNRRKAQYIKMLGGECVICGSKDGLQFDHKDHTTKAFEITRVLWWASEVKLAAEIKKCQLLCVKCHGQKTLKDKGQRAAKGTHGTLSAYRYCRCPKCVAAHSSYCTAWKLRRKQDAILPQ